jgi:hypothetical protein
MSKRCRRLFRWTVSALLVLGSPSFAHAYVECVVNPSKYFIASDGSVYVMWSQGGAGRILANTAGNRGMLATVLTAMNSNRRLIIRLAAGSNCAVENNLVGIWLET